MSYLEFTSKVLQSIIMLFVPQWRACTMQKGAVSDKRKCETFPRCTRELFRSLTLVSYAREKRESGRVEKRINRAGRLGDYMSSSARALLSEMPAFIKVVGYL